MVTIKGQPQVIKEMHDGAVLLANGCTAMLQRPNGSVAFVNRQTARALIKKTSLFDAEKTGPSETKYKLNGNGVQVHRQNKAQGLI